MKLEITRLYYEPQQTRGVGKVLDKEGKPLFEFVTMELPWKDNARRVSCIPKGTYVTVKRFSPKYNEHFHLTDVPGRDMILIHHGNYNRQTLGCILPGKGFADIDGDGLKDVTTSIATMKFLNDLLPDRFETFIA